MRQAGFILPTFLALLLLAGCTNPVPPTVTLGPLVDISENPSIFLTASRQYPRVQQSLSDAGLSLVSSASDADYYLVVTIGRSRTRYQCGIMANIIYSLSRPNNSPMLVIKARGKTGACEPNILDELSQTLAAYNQ